MLDTIRKIWTREPVRILYGVLLGIVWLLEELGDDLGTIGPVLMTVAVAILGEAKRRLVTPVADPRLE